MSAAIVSFFNVRCAIRVDRSTQSGGGKKLRRFIGERERGKRCRGVFFGAIPVTSRRRWHVISEKLGTSKIDRESDRGKLPCGVIAGDV